MLAKRKRIISSQEFELESIQKEIPVIKAVIKKPITLEKLKNALEIANLK